MWPPRTSCNHLVSHSATSYDMKCLLSITPLSCAMPFHHQPSSKTSATRKKEALQQHCNELYIDHKSIPISYAVRRPVVRSFNRSVLSIVIVRRGGNVRSFIFQSPPTHTRQPATVRQTDKRWTKIKTVQRDKKVALLHTACAACHCLKGIISAWICCQLLSLWQLASLQQFVAVAGCLR